jgi:hypothetical protein
LRNAFFGALVVLLAGFDAGAAAPKKIPRLKVTRFIPHHLQMLVTVDSRIVVRFNRPLDTASVSEQTAQLRKLSGERVAVTYEFDKKHRTLFMYPVERLMGSTDYQIVVRPGLLSKEPRNKRARTLAVERTSGFYTKSVPPQFALLRPDQFETLSSTMVENRAAHTAVTMWNRRVLLAAGMTDYSQYGVSGDVFDGTTKSFRPSGGQIRDRRAYAPGVPFELGAMLIGGSNSDGALATTEVYVPGLSMFQPGPSLSEKRDFVAAVELNDGRVLVVGGLDYVGQYAYYSQTAEIYDSDAGGFRLTKGSPIAPRAGHTATLLPDGRVFITGGQSGGTSSPVVSEIFDPETETFTATTLSSQNQRQQHTAALVNESGNVLLCDGGVSLFEMYEATTESFHPAGAASTVNRYGATASLLPDGSVLIAGGLQNNGAGNMIMLDSFDLWKPSGGDYGGVYRPDVIFPEPRYGHTATTLYDGRVLYAGGFGPNGPDSLSTAVLFTPDPVDPK